MPEGMHGASPFILLCNWSITSCVELWKRGICLWGKRDGAILLTEVRFPKTLGYYNALVIGIGFERDQVF